MNEVQTHDAPTQVQHPWRATIRTVVALVLGLLPILPAIVDAAGLSAVPWVVSMLAVAAGITRVLALPQVQALLHRHRLTGWLAATPRTIDGEVVVDPDRPR